MLSETKFIFRYSKEQCLHKIKDHSEEYTQHLADKVASLGVSFWLGR